MNTAAQLALMRLASPALPIGGFSYSQGLESAIEHDWVRDEASLVSWLLDCMALSVGRYEWPIAHAMFDACARDNGMLTGQLHEEYLASRESAELYAETVQMGYSLLRLLTGLTAEESAGAPIARARSLLESEADCALPMAWALAARHFGLTAGQALTAYAWAWLENQVAAGIKAVPLGQQVGQRVLERLQPVMAATLERAPTSSPEGWSSFAPGFGMASAWHENQYSRLFRS